MTIKTKQKEILSLHAFLYYVFVNSIVRTIWWLNTCKHIVTENEKRHKDSLFSCPKLVTSINSFP